MVFLARLPSTLGAFIRRPASVGLAAISLVLLEPAAALAASTVVGVPQILDANTVKIDNHVLKLDGIDAPDVAQRCVDSHLKPWPCGRDALKHLIARAGGQTWTCNLRGYDGLGHVFASCSVAGADIAKWMVRSGWALSFTHCSRKYDSEQKKARQSHAGLWSGAFIAPLDWRNRNRFTYILGAVSVPVYAQKYLLPALQPMEYKVATAKPACYPIAPRRSSPARAVIPSGGANHPQKPTSNRIGNPPTNEDDGVHCRQDLKCFAARNLTAATAACQKSIDQLAKTNVRWIDQWYQQKFDHAKWMNKAAGIIIYSGDKMLLSEPDGSWARYAYACDYDAVTQRVLNVRAHQIRSAQ